jgi:hypothetical protein
MFISFIEAQRAAAVNMQADIEKRHEGGSPTIPVPLLVLWDLQFVDSTVFVLCRLQ